MDATKICEILAQEPLLANLQEADYEELAGCGHEVRFQTGHYLFFEGDPANVFYLLLDGTVRLEIAAGDMGMVPLETLQSGDILGWSWVTEPCTFRFSGRALGPVRLIAFDALCIRGKCDADPRFGYELLKCLLGVSTQRLNAARVRLVEFLV